MKYLPIIVLLAAVGPAEAAASSQGLPVSLHPSSLTITQLEHLGSDFGAMTDEYLSTEQSESFRGAAALSYADVLEKPMRAVVRVESLAGPPSEPETPQSSGSGVIINAKAGYIVTNSHVVLPGQRFRVQLADGRWRDATLVGTDAVTDLAVLKIDSIGLDQVESADAVEPRVGDVVFAVGYPLGLDQTASIGIISGLSRSGGGTQLTDYIQTDAAINSGNSGGALLDGSGRLIGINTAILSSSGGNMGIGFAIPAHVALAIATQLIEFGEVRHARIGVVLGAVGESDSAMAGTADWDGALVVSVEPGSPAEAAGLKPGDIITSFNSRHIKSPQSLRTWIGVSRTDGKIALEVWRAGQHMEFSLRPDVIARPGPGSLSELGAAVRTITPADALPEGLEGVKIEAIRKDSPAEHAGLLAGDIILSINNELVTNPQVCDRLVNEAAGRAGVVIYRGGLVRRIIVEGATQ